MKTPELVDKYQKLLAGLLKCTPDKVHFFVSERQDGRFKEVGKEYQWDEDKPEDMVLQNWSHGAYEVRLEGDIPDSRSSVVGSFKLYQLPHCCGVLVSCNAFVSERLRGMRIGTTLNTMRQDIGRSLGYTIMICTDLAKNTPQCKLLATNGWKNILEFKNKRTGNQLYLAYIGL
jgi:hypothetical protein